jgi:hypothetical protein
MKVKIQARRVYHKFAEVEIEVCEDDFDDYRFENGKWVTLQDYLIDKEEMYYEEVEEALAKSEYEGGNGVEDYDGMNEPESQSEWRYDCKEIHDAGHL